MTQEYEQIREGLLALMCVGDEIKYMHTGITIDHVLTPQIISKVNDKEIVLKDYHHINYSFKEIEHYKGELIIWCGEQEEYHYRSNQRIARMIELIESEETLKFEKNIYGKI